MGVRLRLGVDFDNTVVRYDDVMYRVALDRGLIDSTVSPSKRGIRDRIRQLPDGELEWQRVQALVYGPRIGEAMLAPGAKEFFHACRAHQVAVRIISHKTAYAAVGETRTNLREAAMAWMRTHRFFERDGWGLSTTDVYFESTRAEKITRIMNLGCTHFIDDLEETFLEESFPAHVEKILYAPHGQSTRLPRVRVATSWEEISEYVFTAQG